MPSLLCHRQPAGHRTDLCITEPAPGIHFVQGPAVNWIIISDASGFILIDTGYPGDRGLVLESIEHAGFSAKDALAVLITHGHVDHTGSAAHFAAAYGTPVLCSPEELAHVQGREKHQVTFAKALPYAWRPRVVRWIRHAITAGSLAAVPATAAQAWTPELLRSLPGSPEAIQVPGHTPGNASIYLPAARALITGDSFVTGHPLSRHTGPQMLHRMFHSDTERARESTSALLHLDADVILPGHGPALAMPVRDALATLRG